MITEVVKSFYTKMMRSRDPVANLVYVSLLYPWSEADRVVYKCDIRGMVTLGAW